MLYWLYGQHNAEATRNLNSFLEYMLDEHSNEMNGPPCCIPRGLDGNPQPIRRDTAACLSLSELKITTIKRFVVSFISEAPASRFTGAFPVLWPMVKMLFAALWGFWQQYLKEPLRNNHDAERLPVWCAQVQMSHLAAEPGNRRAFGKRRWHDNHWRMRRRVT